MGIFDDLTEPKRKRGRPPKALTADTSPEPGPALDAIPGTFEGALGVLSDEQRAFVRAYLRDPSKGAAGAYRVGCPDSKLPANRRGPALLKNDKVSRCIALGREQVGRQVAEAVKHDRQAAFEEIGRVLTRAMETDQMTAAARAAELRARLTGVLVDKQEIKSTNFSLVFEGMPQPAQSPAIDVTPPTDPKESE